MQSGYRPFHGGHGFGGFHGGFHPGFGGGFHHGNDAFKLKKAKGFNNKKVITILVPKPNIHQAE
jgi:hypothetical protein